MARVAPHGSGRYHLHDLPIIHEVNAVGQERNDEVVGDVDVGHTTPLANIFQQVKDLSFEGDVQRRYRLVEHDKSRTRADGAGDTTRWHWPPLSWWVPARYISGSPTRSSNSWAIPAVRQLSGLDDLVRLRELSADL